ncbi:unnamed protein product [Amoebophrya sp. A120]|nr:unnamed protein product [Amoebophrya sp. A120]|eukprot:GSA120T00001406001.1
MGIFANMFSAVDGEHLQGETRSSGSALIGSWVPSRVTTFQGCTPPKPSPGITPAIFDLPRVSSHSGAQGSTSSRSSQPLSSSRSSFISFLNDATQPEGTITSKPATASREHATSVLCDKPPTMKLSCSSSSSRTTSSVIRSCGGPRVSSSARSCFLDASAGNKKTTTSRSSFEEQGSDSGKDKDVEDHDAGPHGKTKTEKDGDEEAKGKEDLKKVMEFNVFDQNWWFETINYVMEHINFIVFGCGMMGGAYEMYCLQQYKRLRQKMINLRAKLDAEEAAAAQQGNQQRAQVALA